ncbi:MAG: FapA family protein, partial [Treponema sp.]|nr:FapA family protein [Treponema sp.]
MIDFAQLQEITKVALERDRSVRSIESSGSTLEIAVSQAAALLNIPIFRIEYEVIERGFPGFWGMGQKDWRIMAYERISLAKKKRAEADGAAEVEEKASVAEVRDGKASVFMRSGGDVLLKITGPSGGGDSVPEVYALQLISARGGVDIDARAVSKAIREEAGKYVVVARFEHHSYNDSVMAVKIDDPEMRAFITVSPPGDGGCDIALESYISTLKYNRVVHGIKEDFLQEFVDYPVYLEEIEVAVGSKPVDGKAAYIKYEFETDQSKARFREGTDGKIDFKELNIIQNVTEN